MPSNAKYTSPEIQTELISIATSKIREDIYHEATDASIIAIMVDDSKDIFRKEHMSICICHKRLPSLNVHEEFLMLKHMIDVDKRPLSEAILSSLAALELGSCIIVAQCYSCNERPCERGSGTHQTVA